MSRQWIVSNERLFRPFDSPLDAIARLATDAKQHRPPRDYSSAFNLTIQSTESTTRSAPSRQPDNYLRQAVTALINCDAIVSRETLLSRVRVTNWDRRGSPPSARRRSDANECAIMLVAGTARIVNDRPRVLTVAIVIHRSE